MSIAKNFEETLGFLPHDESKGPFARFAAQVAVYFSAMRDGLAAAHTYSELTARGVPHDRAIKQVFQRHLNS